MSVLLFIAILVALIVVHELGHFFAAKWSGMKVEEFGIGYPPRAWGKKVGETEYTFNWLPFGGFVRIFGEDEAASPETSPDAPRAFFRKPRILQALVLLAGIAMNLAFAYVLITITLALGAPRALEPHEIATVVDARVMVANVLPDSPADTAGFKPGDTIVSATAGAESFAGADADQFTAFVGSQEEPVSFTVLRSGEEQSLTATPAAGIAPGEPERRVLGVSVASVGTVITPWYQAPIDGALATWNLTRETAIALAGFFAGVFTLTADLSQVSGPIGIAGAVGDASESGLAQLLTLTALISINLALINVLPIPALDGGRLLFVAIESIIRRPLSRTFQNWVNTAGFAFLIFLMLAVTASDVFKLVS